MRIAQVVTLISEDGAFGGPVSVARNQVAELARRGHDVTLLAGWDGIAKCVIPGVDVQLHRVKRVLPAPGFSGLATPGLWRSLQRLQPTLDAAHVHLGRDLVTMTAARGLVGGRARLVTQTHGMVMPDHRLLARVTDQVATRRVLRGAHAVTSLTDTESIGLREIGGEAVRPIQLPNGIGVGNGRQKSRAAPPRVVFCARLHPRKRVLAFAEMAKDLITSGADADFVVAGPDEGDLGQLTAYIAEHELGDRIRYLGSLAPDDVRNFLAESAVFVLPSEREPFPMTLLEAMAEGTPAVITDGCMIADRFRGDDGPQVTDGSPAELAAAVRRLLDNPTLSRLVRQRSRELIAEHFGIEAVVDQLERIYAE